MIKTTFKTSILLLSLIIGAVFIVGCESPRSNLGYTYVSKDGGEGYCIKIKPPISLNTLNFKYRYINAELRDLRDKRFSGEMTNLEYVKEEDRLRTKFPREFVWIDMEIKMYQEEENRYSSLVSGLPNGTGATLSVVYLELDDFSNLPRRFNVGETIRVLTTNMDGTMGGFYYPVVKVDIDGQQFTSERFCE